jgi:hypothetical protein
MKLAAHFSVPDRQFLGFCERVDDYAAAVDTGGETFGFTSGDFSLIDVIRAIVRKMQSPAIVLSTWTAAGSDMQHVLDFLDEGKISAARWIVDRSFQNRQPALCQTLRDKFGDEAIRVQRVHCKFALLEDASRKIILQTSANLNRNMRIENVSVSACPVFFTAYSQLVADIFQTQMPTDGFDASEYVTSSFKAVAKKRAKKKTIQNPWLNPKA